jgi:hypothetical protein
MSIKRRWGNNGANSDAKPTEYPDLVTDISGRPPENHAVTAQATADSIGDMPRSIMRRLDKYTASSSAAKPTEYTVSAAALLHTEFVSMTTPQAAANSSDDMSSKDDTASSAAKPTEYEGSVTDTIMRQAAADHMLMDVPTMDCAHCDRRLCETNALCFFTRDNIAGRHEVHLILKPYYVVDTPPSFVHATTKPGCHMTWECVCGHHLGDTRPVGPNKALMTAFKSAAVKLYGQHLTGRKSQWPKVYNTHPFAGIQVRDKHSFHVYEER